MNTKVVAEELEKLQENVESVDHQHKESLPEDGLWAGMMTASVFGGKLFPKES
ncbi:MAG: hypothetical protein KJO91_13015 [Gammaproteobacteria bacterium]|nr:hypothetical protein [Gammaproteobacteria bacterium]